MFEFELNSYMIVIEFIQYLSLIRLAADLASDENTGQIVTDVLRSSTSRYANVNKKLV